MILGFAFYLKRYREEESLLYYLTLFFVMGAEFYLMWRIRERGSGEIESEDGQEEQIDFSKNSPTINIGEMDKPIDLTGNVFEHNIETMKEDLGFLEESKNDDNENS